MRKVSLEKYGTKETQVKALMAYCKARKPKLSNEAYLALECQIKLEQTLMGICGQLANAFACDVSEFLAVAQNRFECQMPDLATGENVPAVLTEFAAQTGCADVNEFLNRWCYKHLCDKKRAAEKAGTSETKEATGLVKAMLAKGFTIEQIAAAIAKLGA